MINKNMIVDSFNKGKQAEELMIQYFEMCNMQIVDVRDINYYRKADVDFIVCAQDASYKFFCDIKYDSCYKTGNYAIETVSNVEKGTQGWLYTSKSDYICILYPILQYKQYELHMLDLPALREYVSKNEGKFREITNSTLNKNGVETYCFKCVGFF